MALFFGNFDDYYHPSQQFSIYPRRRNLFNDNLYSSIIGDGLRELQHLERELGQLKPNEDDKNAFNFRCNVAGYSPEELKVDLEGNELVLKGEHKQAGDGQSVHRTFLRRVTLPENINKDTIQCNIDEKGRLHLTAQRKDVPIQDKQSIPIGFKQSTAPTQDSQQVQPTSEEAKTK